MAVEKTIWKYEITPSDFQEIIMPVGAKILDVQTQGDTPCIWALVNPNYTDTEVRIFEVFATGVPIKYDMGVQREYIGTFQLMGGGLVFHLFEYTGV